MATHHEDEQTVETLKKWWDENGRSVVAGVVIGVGAIAGWRGWGLYQAHIDTAASARYAALQQAGQNGDIEAITKDVAAIEEAYPSTPYASLAALDLAKRRAEQGDVKAAEMQLRWVLSNGDQPTLVNLARVRLARTLVAARQYDEALDLVSKDLPESFASIAEEIRGDALARKGDVEKAREAYDRALAAGGTNQFLSMKRADLAGQGDS